MGRQGDHWQAGARRLGLPNGPRRLHPVHHRHGYIHQDEVVGPPPDAMDALLPVMGFVHLVPVLFKKVAQNDAVDAIVLHDQDLEWLDGHGRGGPGRVGPVARGLRRGVVRARQWQTDPEQAALTLGALQFDLAAHRIHQPLDDRQPKPRFRRRRGNRTSRA